MELYSNPFYILDLPCTVDRATIYAATDVSFPDEVEEEAQRVLLTPGKRLEAEMDWFIDATDLVISSIRVSIEQNKLLDIPKNAGILSQINASAYNLSVLGSSINELRWCISWLDHCFSILTPIDVTSAINECRRKAGFPTIRETDVAAQINRKRADIRSRLTKKLHDLDEASYIDLITQLADALKKGSHGGIIADAIDQYELRMDEIIKMKTKVVGLCVSRVSKAKGNSDIMFAIKDLTDTLSRWAILVRPIQIRSKSSGLRHQPSQELGMQLVRLANYLCESSNLQPAAQRLLSELHIAFEETADFPDQFASIERQFLSREQHCDLPLEQQQIETQFHALKKRAELLGTKRGESLYGDRRAFVSDVESLLTTVQNSKSITDKEKAEIYDGVCSASIYAAIQLHKKYGESAMAFFLLKQLIKAFEHFPEYCMRLSIQAEEINTQMYGSSHFATNAVGRTAKQQVTEAQLDEWFSSGNDYYNKGNYEKAVAMFRKGAENGHAPSQFSLGVCYKDGKGVSQSDGESAFWYKKAAEQNNRDAQFWLARAFETGRGVVCDVQEAFRWYLKSAENGHVDAQTRIGRCYEFGQGTEKDACSAAKWYRKAADQGDDDGLCCLGVCYENGIGIEKDAQKATELYRIAAEHGYGRAQSALGLCYEFGRGLPLDTTAAAAWYLESARSGYATGQTNLGVCFDNGSGVDPDPVEAAKWFKKAAEQGDDRGQCFYAICLANGKGVQQNLIEAAVWYRRAADQGNSQAQNNLGACYEDGKGVNQDLAEALKWYRLAAEQGEERAKQNLARLL